MKWISLGSFEVYADKDSGRIFSSIHVGLPSSPLQPFDVVVRDKSIGKYINIEKAKRAAEIALGADTPNNDSMLANIVNRFQRMREEPKP